LDAQFARTLQESQTSEEGGDLDPHVLSRKQNNEIIETVFGPSKKGRRRFRGAGAWTSDDTTTSSEPTMPSPSPMQQQSYDTSVHSLLSSVIAILVNKIHPADFAMLVPDLYSGVPSHIEGAISHIVVSLAGKIPNEVYADIVRQITVYLNTTKYINN